MQRLVQNKKTNQIMELYINLDNCRKEHPEIEFKLDVQGTLHVSCPKKYSYIDVIPSLLTRLELDNEGLTFSSAAGTGASDERWYARIPIDVEIEYFVKEDSKSTPANGKTTMSFVALRPEIPLIEETQIYKVNSDEEAHKMALEDKSCIGYNLFRREYTKVDGKTTKGEPEIYKRVVFGKVYTLEEIRDIDEDYATDLCIRMIVFNLDKAIKTRNGGFIVWEKDVEYISE